MYYAVDPGFQRAIAGGYFSNDYLAGMESLLIVGGAGLSGAATGFLVAFWASVRKIGGFRWVVRNALLFLVSTLSMI